MFSSSCCQWENSAGKFQKIITRSPFQWIPNISKTEASVHKCLWKQSTVLKIVIFSFRVEVSFSFGPSDVIRPTLWTRPTTKAKLQNFFLLGFPFAFVLSTETKTLQFCTRYLMMTGSGRKIPKIYNALLKYRVTKTFFQCFFFLLVLVNQWLLSSSRY